MAHGSRDCGNVIMPSQVHRVDDLGELAARLGSMVLFHRSGNVVFLEDFESGLGAWGEVPDLDANYVRLETSEVYGSGVVAQLLRDNPVSSTISLDKFLPPILTGKVGLSVVVSFVETIESFRLMIYNADATTTWRGSIRYDQVTRNLYYYEDAVTPRLFGNRAGAGHGEGIYHTLKFVIDMDTKKYHSLTFDGDVYDLTAYNLWSPGGASPYRMRIWIMMANIAGSESVANLDNVVVTFNET